MTHTATHADCPGLSTLADWFEGTLEAAEAGRIEQHLDHCSRCRLRALEWSERLEGVASDAVAPAGCIDAETLLAYSSTPDGLERTAAAQVEQHLQQCTRCVGNLQHFMRLHRQLESPDPTPALVTQPATVEAPHPAVAPRHRTLSPAPRWWQRLGELLTPQMWTGAAFAAAMAMIIAIGVSRFVSPSGPDQEMRVRNATQVVTVEVTSDTVGRPRPSPEEPIVVELPRGTRARWLETNGEWTRVELADGRRVWVESRAVTRIRAD